MAHGATLEDQLRDNTEDLLNYFITDRFYMFAVCALEQTHRVHVTGHPE